MRILLTILFTIINLIPSGFYELDTKASSMGGAGLTNSGYFNPAVLAGKKTIDFSFKTGAEIKTNKKSIDWLKDIQKLTEFTTISSFGEATNALSSSIIRPLINPNNLIKLNNNEKLKIDLSDTYINDIKTTKRIIKDTNNLTLDATVGAGINLDIHNYSLAFIKNISVGIVPLINNKLEIIKDISISGKKKYIKVDLDTKEIYQTTKSDYDNNSLFVGKNNSDTSKINTNIVAFANIAILTEIPFMYSYRHNMNYKSAFDGYLNLGLSVKYMMLEKGKISLSLKNEINLQDYFTKTSNTKSYSSASLDFGLLYYPNRLSGFKTGLVFKNITSPQFDDKTLKPMVRYGLAFSKWNLDTAFDYDITKNKTLSGRDTQIMGGGIGYNPYSWLGVSLGVKKDLANDKLGTILATGFVLSIVELSAQFSDNRFYQFQFNLNI
jgi:hypothetical protein